MSKLTKRISLLLLAVLAACVFAAGTFLFAGAEETTTSAMTSVTGFWGDAATDFGAGNKFTADKTGVAAGAGCSESFTPTGVNYDQNHYKFTLNIQSIDADADFFADLVVRGEAINSIRPWSAPAGTLCVILRAGSVQLFGKDVIKFPEGTNLKDGKDHVFETLINDDNKSVTLIFDGVATDPIVFDSINAEGGIGFHFFQSKVTISAPQAGYTATEVTVSEASSNAQMKVGETLTLAATVKPAKANQNVTWTSDNEEVATVANGVVTGVAEGKTKIKATASSGLVGEYEVEVVSDVVAPTAIALDKTEETVVKTQTLQLAATFAPAETTNQAVTWTSSDEAVATVDANGLVTAVANAGEATITAVSVADNTLKATCKVTAAPLNATSVTVPATLKIEAGDARAFAFAPVPAAADDSFTVTVADETVATYSEGKLTALKAGTTKITVVSGVNAEVKGECDLTVIVPAAPEGMPSYPDYQEAEYTIGCDPSLKDMLTVGEGRFDLDTSAAPDTGVTFFPMNGDSPKIDFNVSALTFGLKMNTSLTGDWLGAVLFRTKNPATIFYSNPAGIELRFHLNETQVYLHHGDGAMTLLGKTAMNPADGLTHYYAIEVDGANVTAWVDGAKIVDNYDGTELFGKWYNVEEENSFAISSRKTVLNVTDLKVYDTSIPEPADDTIDAITLDKTTASVEVGKTITLTAEVTGGEDRDTTVVWKTSNSSLATVANGVVTGVKAGTVTITAEAADGKTATCTITVTGGEKPGDDKPDPEKPGTDDPAKENKGCGSAVYAGVGAILLSFFALGAACVLLKRKHD